MSSGKGLNLSDLNNYVFKVELKKQRKLVKSKVGIVQAWNFVATIHFIPSCPLGSPSVWIIMA